MEAATQWIPKQTGIRYTRTASATWLGESGGLAGQPVTGRAGKVGQEMTVKGFDQMRNPTNTPSRIRKALQVSGFTAPRGTIVDVFGGPVKGMTGPLELAMCLMALSASGQIQPIDWKTLIVGQVDWKGNITAGSDTLAYAIYQRLKERSDYQLICPARMLEQMPVNHQFTHKPIGLGHLSEIRSHPVFTERLG